METVQYLKDRIIYLKKCEMEYFDKQYTLPHGHLLRKQYREFSNEFHARRDELEIFEKLLSESTHETPKVSINKQAKEVCDHECSGVQNTGYLRECIKCGEYYKDKQTGCL